MIMRRDAFVCPLRYRSGVCTGSRGRPRLDYVISRAQEDSDVYPLTEQRVGSFSEQNAAGPLGVLHGMSYGTYLSPQNTSFPQSSSFVPEPQRPTMSSLLLGMIGTE
jgi:hypothetical protein